MRGRVRAPQLSQGVRPTENMPPCLDVYVVTHLRDLDTLNRFVQLYVDRQASDDRGDEQLMMLPLGANDEPKGSDQWDWEPARDFDHVMSRALDHPRRAFAFCVFRTIVNAHSGRW